MLLSPPAASVVQTKSATGVGTGTGQSTASANRATRIRTSVSGWSAAASRIAGIAARAAQFREPIRSPVIEPEQSTTKITCRMRRAGWSAGSG